MENNFNILFYYLVKVGECLKTPEGLHHYWLFRVNVGDVLAACESNDKSKRSIIITDEFARSKVQVNAGGNIPSCFQKFIEIARNAEWIKTKFDKG